MKPIVWIHGDALSPQNPALLRHPKAPALWVWDDSLLKDWQISLKRVVFIYECLLELPVTIRRGDPATELRRFAQAHGADCIATTDSPSPRFNQIADAIEADFNLEICDGPEFAAIEGYVDLKRFSRYWKTAQQSAFEPTTGGY
ncbi:hypothetical protein [Synechococcus elongatus]|uniref:Photolyase/cryptochrome alpha/beta domain-containing protein n=2 Tax=Synechococcus elongatus TaxID=32046 RepID=Q31M21_SYNE7|nr:hypothetical protein [Synechococcus elongatus]ABB57898.1 conserved hypothetical protein [Synechococcus elongatus PCC 7942 = FACHB-805]AJD57621.1 DNA polymerase [Synechococcus elongatus UTEX 2973]MBD2586615.1 hypothetical protein [Synechococcus elongatus FACHB-242]MBD2687689.1 hypothetical protein [Synechococcus elongatus FACHB-1061]MBD2706601.1 hypothetical protein [Synechococcus elongatus PCC 7942 = FACHB-805]